MLSRSIVSLKSLPSRALLALLAFYRQHLSGLKGRPTCRFIPSCSEYAQLAIQRRGALRGLALTVARFLRCNPLFEGGYHPAPQAACCDQHAAHASQPRPLPRRPARQRHALTTRWTQTDRARAQPAAPLPAVDDRSLN